MIITRLARTGVRPARDILPPVSGTLRRARHLVFAAGCLYWLAPGHFTLAATSAPPVDVMSIAGISWLWLLCYGFDWGRQPAGRALAGVLVLCLAATLAAWSTRFLAQSQGLAARYYDNATFEGPAERSWTGACDGCTRVDRQLAFGPRGHAFASQYFPLFFANDSQRREWSAGSAGRSTDGYRFSAEWNGFLEVPAATNLNLESTGGVATLTVDGAAAARGPVALQPGTHAVQVRYARTDDAAPSLRLRWIVGDRDETVPAAALRRGPRAAIRPWLAPLLCTVGFAAWLAALLALQLAAAPWRLRVASAAWWALFQLLFLKSVADVVSAGAAFGFQIFRPGNDYLVYETFARSILSGDLLSRIEGPLVHLNFAYRYILAALHLAAGEAPADVMVLEQAVKALIVVLASARVARLYGTRAGVATAAIAAAANQLVRLEPPLLDTPWSVAASAVALFAAIEYGRRPSGRLSAVMGLSLGAAGLLRPNLIPLLAIAIVWVAAAGRRARHDSVWRHAVTVAGAAVMVLALLPLRNLVVAGEPRWLPENGLVNLWIGNHPREFDGPTYFVVKSAPPRELIVARVLEYCRAEPGALARRATQKALYVLGIDTRDGARVAVGVLLPWLFAAAGTVLLWRRRAPVDRRELALLWVWVALVNAPLIAVFPWSYGWRLSAPSFIPIYAICGATVAAWLGSSLWWRPAHATRFAAPPEGPPPPRGEPGGRTPQAPR